MQLAQSPLLFLSEVQGHSCEWVISGKRNRVYPTIPYGSVGIPKRSLLSWMVGFEPTIPPKKTCSVDDAIC